MKRRAVNIATFLVAFAAMGTLAAPTDSAKAILDGSGVKGGLIVHVGCGAADGELTAALRQTDRFLVQGLDTTQEAVDKARARIRAHGPYGNTTASLFDGTHLPYTENLVNLLILPTDSKVTQEEAFRVLVPGGVLCRIHPSSFIPQPSVIKPRPAELDEWTHYLGGPDNNAVSADTVIDIPRSFQWVSEPRWGRSHEELASMSAAVATNGRVFYIVDEAPLASIRFSGDWKLVARDAFNGVLLWKHPISSWNDHLRHFRSGPAHLARRLVAVGDAVYVTPGFTEPVVVLDAATGARRHTFDGTERTEEIIADGDVVYLVVGTSEAIRRGGGLFDRKEPEPTDSRHLMAFQAQSGSLLWKKDITSEGILPSTLAAKKQRIYYQSTYGMVCLDARSGDEVWKTARPTPSRRMGFSAPTLVATDDVILCADREAGTSEADSPSKGTIEWGVHGWNEKGFSRGGKTALIAYSVADGKELWRTGCREGYNSPVDVFVIDNVVWVGPDFRGLDLKTGEQVGKIDTKAPRVGMPHHRCYRNKASQRFIFTGKSGIEVLSIDQKKWLCNNSWVRGTCQYGIMPANGLLYAPPDACACFLTSKAPGFFAVAPRRGTTGHMPFPDTPVLQKGPAFSRLDSSADAFPTAQSGDWPVYRHDVTRSGFATCGLPEFPKERWSADVGGRLTQATIAGGKVFIASVDTHTVHALSEEDGREVWRYTAGGRVDSAPTWFRGQLVFGSADGWLYCLNASDGALAWRLRLAPEERLVSSYGQLESVWPVHGTVIVQNNTIFATAGRSSYLDGGIVLYRVDPFSGKELARTVLYHLDPETGEQLVPEAKFNMEGTTTDILSGNGDQVHLKYFTFDRDGKRTETTEPRLFPITGFLGEEWFVRSYWIIGTQVAAGWGGWANAANWYPAGRILSFGDGMVYGYGRQKLAGGPVGHRADAYHMFGAPLEAEDTKPAGKKKRGPSKPGPVWSDPGSHIVRAMVANAQHLVSAGPADAGQKSADLLAFDNEEDALAGFRGQKGILLRVCRSSDGKPISQSELPAMPVFDGISAAHDRLYVALKNGKLVCLEAGEGTPLPDPPPSPPQVQTTTPAATPGPAKPLPKLTGPDKKASFDHVDAAGIVGSDLGYRLAAAQGATALAVRKLDTPLTGKATFKLKLGRAPGFVHPGVYENAFLAFGNGPKDTDLVKCGVKLVVTQLVIITGETQGPAAVSEKLPLDKTKPVDIEVTVDLAIHKVSLTVNGKTIQASIPASVKQITHVGYCTSNAVSDFGEVETVAG